MTPASQPVVLHRPWGQLTDEESPTPVEQLAMAGYCHPGTVRTDFMECLIKMIGFERDHGRHLDSLTNTNGAYIPQLRNELVRTFLAKRKAHWFLMLDNDMVFAPNTLSSLLELADPEKVPILAALYLTPMHRWQNPDELNTQPEMLPTWGHREGDIDWKLVTVVDFDEPLMPLQWCGMGCTLIHRKVFEAVAEEYSDDPWTWFGHDLVTKNGKVERTGEDTGFCERASLLGFPIHGTPKVTCGHIKTTVVHPLSYAQERANPLARGV